MKKSIFIMLLCLIGVNSYATDFSGHKKIAAKNVLQQTFDIKYTTPNVGWDVVLGSDFIIQLYDKKQMGLSIDLKEFNFKSKEKKDIKILAFGDVTNNLSTVLSGVMSTDSEELKVSVDVKSVCEELRCKYIIDVKNFQSQGHLFSIYSKNMHKAEITRFKVTNDTLRYLDFKTSDKFTYEKQK